MDEKETTREFSLYPALLLMARSWRLVLRNMLAAAAVAAVIAFILPSRWRAVATLMPPQEKETSAVGAMLAQITLPGMQMPKPQSNAQLFVEILKSRTLNERILNRRFAVGNDSLPLYRILRFKSPEIGYYRMIKKTQFMVLPNDIVSVAVELRNPNLAADVANAYIEELDRLNLEKSVSRAKNSRLYIESQLAETERRLRAASERLALFQQQNKAVSLEHQVQAYVEQAADLSGKILAKEIEIGVMLQSMTSDNPLVVRARSELEEMRRRAREMEIGKDRPSIDGYLPFRDIPPLALQLAEQLREVKVQETVWQLLTQQYYQAKIEEARNTPTVQVLDPATPPVFRSFPNRKLMVIVAAVLSAVLSLIYVILLDYFHKLRSRPESRRRLELLVAELKKGWNPFSKS
ncbi:MAG: Wzz/FepE/Etk N-terminal domain-containing protein [candidate division KSB1 bacterium]|nr:Wzz/FepE/Etk N-terminal domain-containing protein [candidate division KSB1 bacterium]